MSLAVVVFLSLVSISTAAGAATVLRTVPDDIYCDSWRLSVETNNAGPWSSIPRRCESFVASYMTGPRYLSDSEVVASDTLAFASSIAAGVGPADAWVFDVDETLLSNLPFYEVHGFGVVEFNETLWDEWVVEARAPALPASLRLYEELRGLGFRMVLLTGRGEQQRALTEHNLLIAGYTSWDRLILRNATDVGKKAVDYKSEKRALVEAEGYRILGNSGDQWSDLLGSATAARSFKLPNPMYHIE